MEPSFSPIVVHHKKTTSAHSTFASRSKHNSASAADASPLRPKYQCPACLVLFLKWSPCLSHLREMHLTLFSHLLDKKQNGGDFRKIQEWCASTLKPVPPRGERTDSIESFSSDSGGEEELGVKKFPSVPVVGVVVVAKPPRLPPSMTSYRMSSSSPSPATTPRAKPKPSAFSVFNDRIVFCIFSFLDVESAQNWYLAMEVEQPRPRSSSNGAAVSISRVRIWSNASTSSMVSDPRVWEY